MKTRPILFSGPMVRAILNGRKTQTRRVMKPQPMLENVFVGGMHRDAWVWKDTADPAGWLMHSMCPHGKPGDRLWVRETWAYGVHALASERDEDGPFVYAADGTDQGRLCSRWRPSIHMPRTASRILLDITSIRVERLQKISAADARAEGIARDGDGYERFPVDPDAPAGQSFTRNPVLAYRGLWDYINGRGAWDANPWVWVIEFKRAEGGEA